MSSSSSASKINTKKTKIKSKWFWPVVIITIVLVLTLGIIVAVTLSSPGKSSDTYSWSVDDTVCNQISNCNKTVTRKVTCVDNNNQVVDDSKCTQTKPSMSIKCDPCHEYEWQTNNWVCNNCNEYTSNNFTAQINDIPSDCKEDKVAQNCKNTYTREVVCKDKTVNVNVDDKLCKGSKPQINYACDCNILCKPGFQWIDEKCQLPLKTGCYTIQSTLRPDTYLHEIPGDGQQRMTWFKPEKFVWTIDFDTDNGDAQIYYKSKKDTKSHCIRFPPNDGSIIHVQQPDHSNIKCIGKYDPVKLIPVGPNKFIMVRFLDDDKVIVARYDKNAMDGVGSLRVKLVNNIEATIEHPDPEQILTLTAQPEDTCNHY